MQVAALDNSLDHDAWLAANTAYCQRHRCRLTVADCAGQRVNRRGEHSDLRCQGCGGLDNQPEAIDEIGVFDKVTPHLQLVRPIRDETPLPCAGIYEQAGKQSIDPLTQALAEVLQEILAGDDDIDDDDDADRQDGEEQNGNMEAARFTIIDSGASSKPVNLEELDPVTRLLLQEMYKQEEEAAPEPSRVFVERKKTTERGSRVRVFMGRCHRCGGGMLHGEKECHDGIIDDEVYRCFNCGWRISPAYDYNRKHPEEGWI